MTRPRVVIIAKAPVPGFAKTRLIPALGAAGAAALARRMLDHVLGEALAADVGSVELCVTPEPGDAGWRRFTVPRGVDWSAQGDGDLGRRMARAAERSLARGEPVLLIGSDCPQLDATTLRAAAALLDGHDACLAPTHDGGYVLLGLRRPCPAVFEDLPWSTAQVRELTLQRLQAAGLSVALLPTLRDIDEPADLQYLPGDLAGAGGPGRP